MGLLKGYVKKFSTGGEEGIIGEDHKYKVPHMGWNSVRQIKPHPLWSKIPDDSRFYFVHSYFVTGAANEIVVANTSYSAQFVSAISKDNIFAVQFHPEKSQRVGLQLLSNFLKWDGYA